MNYVECFRAIARHRTDEIVITSAGNSGQAWWAATRNSVASFYLDASMSLSTMFASGLALAQPDLKIWAFMGDGAFAINPGHADGRAADEPAEPHAFSGVQPRLWRDLECRSAEFAANDYAAIARAFGLERVFEFRSIDAIERELPALKASNAPGHTFVVLEVEPFSDDEQKLEQPPFDGPELKFRFGRHVESLTGCDIFGYRI